MSLDEDDTAVIIPIKKARQSTSIVVDAGDEKLPHHQETDTGKKKKR